MTKLTLIGDSIRMAYQPVVAAKLAGKFDVWGPVENGGTSRNVLANLDQWAIARSADIVHINCGLHDLKRNGDFTTCTVPLPEYASNLRTILGRLRKETRARIIWVTTTPVVDEWHLRVKKFERRQADVLLYNQTATAIALELGVEINDLHAAVVKNGIESCLQPDGVHMNPVGNEALATAVAHRVQE